MLAWYFFSLCLKSFSVVKAHPSLSPLHQSTRLIDIWPRLLTRDIIFTALKPLEACSQSNKCSLSKLNSFGLPTESARLALLQLLRVHTQLYWREKQCLVHGSISRHTRKQIWPSTLSRILWLEPAALTQQHINHWALSSAAGPQCHDELDSTGITVRNKIQKLIQARDNCWQYGGPGGADTPLWQFVASTTRPLTSTPKPAGCYWSET